MSVDMSLLKSDVQNRYDLQLYDDMIEYDSINNCH